MLRRPPTSITLTPEDVAAYEDRRARQLELRENVNPNSHTTNTNTNTNTNIYGTPKKGAEGKVDPNDELKPLPGDRARVRSGVGGASGREERIMGR